MTWEQLTQGYVESGAAPKSISQWTGIARYGDRMDEYHAARDAVGLHDRSYRCLLELTGADRITWLHNLTTNHVQTLQPGDGNYAFCCNTKGRIIFDLNILVRPDSVWLDIDRRWIDTAIQHLSKYIIIEDVTITDRSADFVRLAVCGAKMPDLMSNFGATNAGPMAQLQTDALTLDGASVPFFKHDFCKTPAVELLAPADRAADLWQLLIERHAAAPVGFDAVDVLRIEAALPWPVTEISEDFLPAETGQLERAVATNKGCYLGQEIIERMRAHDSIARKLVLLHFDADNPPEPETTLTANEQQVGHVTSSCYSPRHRTAIALAYVRTQHATAGTALHANYRDRPIPCKVSAIDTTH